MIDDRNNNNEKKIGLINIEPKRNYDNPQHEEWISKQKNRPSNNLGSVSDTFVPDPLNREFQHLSDTVKSQAQIIAQLTDIRKQLDSKLQEIAVDLEDLKQSIIKERSDVLHKSGPTEFTPDGEESLLPVKSISEGIKEKKSGRVATASDGWAMMNRCGDEFDA